MVENIRSMNFPVGSSAWWNDPTAVVETARRILLRSAGCLHDAVQADEGCCNNFSHFSDLPLFLQQGRTGRSECDTSVRIFWASASAVGGAIDGMTHIEIKLGNFRNSLNRAIISREVLATHEGLEGRAGLGAFQARGEMLGFFVDAREDLGAVATDEIAGDAQGFRRLGGEIRCRASVSASTSGAGRPSR